MKIYFEMDTMMEEIWTNEPKYDFTVLLANMGGQLGLFTGFSVLTGVEIFELFTDLCTALVRRLVANIWWGIQVFPAGGLTKEMA